MGAKSIELERLQIGQGSKAVVLIIEASYPTEKTARRDKGSSLLVQMMTYSRP